MTSGIIAFVLTLSFLTAGFQAKAQLGEPATPGMDEEYMDHHGDQDGDGIADGVDSSPLGSESGKALSDRFRTEVLNAPSALTPGKTLLDDLRAVAVALGNLGAASAKTKAEIANLIAEYRREDPNFYQAAETLLGMSKVDQALGLAGFADQAIDSLLRTLDETARYGNLNYRDLSQKFQAVNRTLNSLNSRSLSLNSHINSFKETIIDHHLNYTSVDPSYLNPKRNLFLDLLKDLMFGKEAFALTLSQLIAYLGPMGAQFIRQMNAQAVSALKGGEQHFEMYRLNSCRGRVRGKELTSLPVDGHINCRAGETITVYGTATGMCTNFTDRDPVPFPLYVGIAHCTKPGVSVSELAIPLPEQRNDPGFYEYGTAGLFYTNDKTAFCHLPTIETFKKAGGRIQNVLQVQKSPRGLRNDGTCFNPVQVGSGLFRLGDAIYYSNGVNGYCHIPSPAFFKARGFQASQVNWVKGFPIGLANHGDCR